MISRLLSYLCFLGLPLSAALAQEPAKYEVYQPGVISLPDGKEGSPSITADGNTLVFTRYRNYGKQAPYIAKRAGDSWQVERWPVVDTLYNLAISPDGQRIVYKVRYQEGEDVSYATYRTDRQADGRWSDPVALPGPLFANAGYFRMAEDGTLYMYINSAAGNPKGIYTAELLPDGSYSPPEWLSDAVSPYSSTTYTPIPNTRENKLIVNRGGLPLDIEKKQLGPVGLYLHQKHNGQWDTGVPIEGIPYTFYAAMTPDDRMIFVFKGDLYEIAVADLNISFSDRSTKNKILRCLSDMETAFIQNDLDSVAAFYARQARIVADGEVIAEGIFGIRDYWNNPEMEPVDWELTSFVTTPDPREIYACDRWQQLPDPPARISELNMPVDPDGFYTFGRSVLTYRMKGERQSSTVYFLLHWTEKWGQPRILVDSY